jgi:hypothetical protein
MGMSDTRREWKGCVMRRYFAIATGVLLVTLALIVPVAQARFQGPSSVGPVSPPSGVHPTVSRSIKNDVSPPLRSLPGAVTVKAREADDFEQLPPVPQGRPNGLIAPVQTRVGSGHIPTSSTSFDGVGNGFSGPQGTFTVNSAPPDTNGAVGPQDYVQIVNTDFAIFNKDASRGAVGTVRYGPVQINTLWSGFGGLCQSDNDGDPIVVYDNIANRWLITQFAVTNPNPNFLQCIAVSTGSDPTGTYNRYAFSYSNFPDYPKFGLWPDAYYATFNMFNASGTSFLGGEVCAFDRTSMLSGASATQQCFSAGSSFGGLLPASLDGSTQPPAGAPNYIVALNTTTSLAFWKFHVDWSNSNNSTFTGPSSIAVASYAQACGGGTCIPQSGTTNQLDSLADRAMYRLAYRNFGSYESLVVDHAVTAGSGVGMRWYEIRSPGTTPTVFQSGTYAPDSNFRWMGSIAEDQSGDMAMGFSLSGSSLHPGISYTGRLVSDPAGQMSQGESNVITGGGSQTGTLTRWGDYSAMQIDPADGCTFWYTNEYIPSNGSFNWKTRINSFKFSSCGGSTSNDFSISANPTSLSIAQGGSGTSTISTAVTSGSAGTVSLTSSVSPAGPTASLNPTSVTAGGSSTLTVNVGSSVATGTYTVTVTGTEGSATHSTSVNVTVTSSGGGGGITNGGFETGSLSGWTAAGTTAISTTAHSGSYSARIGSTSPLNGDSSVSQTFTVPSGMGTLSFWYQVHCTDSVTYDWATATLKDNTTNTTTTVLGHTCTNNSTWVKASTSVTAGHSVTLTLIDHDDGYAGDPTYTLYDDAALAAAVTNPIVNPGFETGNLSGWTAAGTTAISTTAHSGSYSARVGSTSPLNGDSSVSQTFTVPSGASTLTFYYQVHCTDSVTYDWATATLKDNTTGTTTTILSHTCTNNGTWAQVTASVTAGHSYTLTLINHDDGYAGDPTYTLYDDAVVR